jgi:integrase
MLYAKPYIGGISLAQLKLVHVRKMLDDLTGSVGSRALQMVHRVLKQAFAEAIEDELISVNPCLRRDKPKHEPKERNVLTLQEARRLLRAAKRTRYYLLFLIALCTGMRQGEIFGLRWDAVDFDKCAIFVRATLARSSAAQPVLVPPKTSRKRRVDLGRTVTELLRAHHSRRHSEFVFTDEHNRPHKKDKFVRTVFLPLLEKAGIQRIRFHDLRHSSASLALASGINVKVVSERLGHSSAKMTLDVYAHALPTLQREAAAQIEKQLTTP